MAEELFKDLDKRESPYFNKATELKAKAINFINQNTYDETTKTELKNYLLDSDFVYKAEEFFYQNPKMSSEEANVWEKEHVNLLIDKKLVKN